MPEGHSVERLRRVFADMFVGERCAVSSPQGRFTAGAELLDGLEVTEVFAHGKHLFIGFGPEPKWLHVHLGLYGAWRFAGPAAVAEAIGAPRKIDPDRALTGVAVAEWSLPAPTPNVRVRIVADGCVADLTGPTACEVLTSQEVQIILDRLGPDPLKNEPGDRERFIERVRSSRRPVGELIMDQSFAAGVGNIFRAESLFRQRLSPGTGGARVPRYRLGKLWDDLVELMNSAVNTGHIVSVTDEDPQPDEESEAWYVYHRANKECLVCGSTIRTRKAAGRDLFWCPSCQR